MATVQLGWTLNSASEQVTAYHIYQDGWMILEATDSPAVMEVKPGKRDFQVAAVNLWGEGARSNIASIKLKGGPNG